MKERLVAGKDRKEYCEKRLCPTCYFSGDECMIETWETTLTGIVPDGKVVRFKTEKKK